MSKKDPINVVGAGPAGLSAAIVLRRHGLPVRVFEMRKDVGLRHGGNFQGLENWSAERDVTDIIREIGIDVNFTCIPYHKGRVYARGMRPVSVESERPIFYLVKRGAMPGSLDSSLKEQALSLGADIFFGSRTDSPEGKTIIATGPVRANAFSFGMTFDTPSEDRASVVLDDELAPKGYAYVLINGGRGTMASVLYGDFKNGARCLDRLRKFLEKEVGLQIRGERRFAAHVNFRLKGSRQKGETLRAGEAAGFQDCLWGFGMRYAMLSGSLAAKSIIEGADYDKLWMGGLGPMLEASVVNRWLFELFGHAGYRYIARRLSGGNPCEYLRRLYRGSAIKRFFVPFADFRFERRAVKRA